MLTTLIAALSALQAPPATREDPSIVIGHLSEGFFEPPSSTFSVEWMCPRSKQPSKAIITVTDVGKNWKSEIFELKLVSLIVAGRRASDRATKEVIIALGTLNNLVTVAGRCQNELPGLFISGAVKQDGRYTAKKFRISLTDQEK